MLKRIMVFLAIGVALAPAAFAQGLDGYQICKRQAGENSACEMDQAIADGGTQCKYAQIEKQVEAIMQESPAGSQAGGALVSSN